MVEARYVAEILHRCANSIEKGGFVCLTYLNNDVFKQVSEAAEGSLNTSDARDAIEAIIKASKIDLERLRSEYKAEQAMLLPRNIMEELMGIAESPDIRRKKVEEAVIELLRYTALKYIRDFILWR